MKISPAHAEINIQKSKDVRILSFDTEDNSKGTTLILNFFDGEKHYTTRNIFEAQDFIINESKKSKRLEIWCANLNYDIGNIFKFDDSGHLKIITSGSRFISVKSKLFKRVIFKDVFNVMPGQSVKSLGKLVSLEKIDVKGNFDNEYYCQRDTEIVFLALRKFKANLKLLNIDLKATAASTAFNHLVSKFTFLRYSNLTEEQNIFFRSGYYGGRTEVFNVSKQKDDIHGYDIISSYPFAMTDVLIPDTGSIKKSKKFEKEFQGMSEVTLIAPLDLKVPYLPVKDEKLIFPVGIIKGVWTNFEINEALKLGYKIKKFHRGHHFTNDLGFTFSDFIVPIFKSRNEYKKKLNDLMAYVLKILLNSCYGKFAQGGDEIELIDARELEKMKNVAAEVLPNGQAIIKKNSGFKEYTNYYLASIITAKARHNLYQYLIKATKENRILLYCDTDSVFFKGTAFDKAMLGSDLGCLEKQYSILEAHFISPKVYYVKTKEKSYYKCKGVWGELAEDYFKKGIVEKMTPLKYVETCRKNYYIKNSKNKKLKYKTFLPFNFWDLKIKAKKSDYDKRIILKNGDTAPIKLTA